MGSECNEWICSFDGCTKSFKSQKTLRQHIKRHTKPYHCSHSGCKMRFGSSWDRTVHERIHGQQKIEKCTFCKKTFTDPSSLRLHKKRFHSNENGHCNRYCCRICRKPFKTKVDLKGHLLSHHD